MRCGKPFFLCLIVAAIVVLSTACSTSEATKGQDPALVSVVLETTPEQVQISTPVKLSARISGLISDKGAEVQFDIRKTNNKGLLDAINAVQSEGGTYTADYQFKETGRYYVYVHLYQDDLHITKRNELDVR